MFDTLAKNAREECSSMLELSLFFNMDMELAFFLSAGSSPVCSELLH